MPIGEFANDPEAGPLPLPRPGLDQLDHSDTNDGLTGEFATVLFNVYADQDELIASEEQVEQLGTKGTTFPIGAQVEAPSGSTAGLRRGDGEREPLRRHQRRRGAPGRRPDRVLRGQPPVPHPGHDR